MSSQTPRPGGYATRPRPADDDDDTRICDTLPVPQDDRHEFLNKWLREDDEVLKCWERWFRERGVRHTRKVSLGLVMLYTHRFLHHNTRGENRSKWCCEYKLEQAS